MQVSEDQIVKVGKKTVHTGNERIVLAVNKPVGIICTEDRRTKNNIIRFLDYPQRITYAGRLDKDSEGLLIMTNDGDLINRMMRARYAHEKEYKVTVDRPLTDAFIREMSVTRPCKVTKIGKYTFSIVLTQGLNRQIRRMCSALGYEVKKLVRTRIMNIELKDLKTGATRKLTDQELKELYEQTETGTNAGAGNASEPRS